MAKLKDFLSELATDAERLGRFIQDPDAVMAEAELSEEDRAALRSGFAGIIYARLAGMSQEEAFAQTLRPAMSPFLMQTLFQQTPLQIPPITLQQWPLQVFPPPPQQIWWGR